MKNCNTTSLSAAAGTMPVLHSRISRIALAAALAACMSSAHALGFGRMRVQSALGQPLRAEVELTNAQAASLRAGMASPSVYAEKGLDYGSAVKGIRSSVRKLPNGRSVLVLTSDAPINEPFVDVVLQASDGSGSVTRDFSILLDPPASTPTRAPVSVVEPATPRTPADVAKPVPMERIDLPPVAGEESAATRPVRPARRKAASPRVRSGAVRVRQGDTAGQIAARNRPARVSLDQMLVALQRANSHAFINGNVNLLKSGVVLKMPSASEVRAVSPAEARSIIIAQSEDFRTYRNRLARSPMAQTAPSAQQSGGRIQSRIEDTKTSPAVAPDTLTISKADIKAGTATEQRMAEAMQKRDNINRADELNKNLSDLKNISAQVAASAQPGGSAQAEPGMAPVVVPPPPGLASSPAEVASAPASAASDAASAAVQAASEAASAASAAASKPAPRKKPAPPPPPPPAEPGFLEGLLENTLFKGALGLVAVGGLVYVFLRRRQQQAQGMDDFDSALSESNFAPDSFFHVSGGKDIDTSEPTTATGAASGMNQSSMLYSPSQLDAEADVDPVAEADVYLAYGRDIQAEEILKDALFKQPESIPVHIKLLEIYARRRDLKTYAQFATELKQLTRGTGQDWEAVRAKGAEIDPDNALYMTADMVSKKAAAASAGAVEPATAAPAMAEEPVAAAPAIAEEPVAAAPALHAQSPTPDQVRSDLLQQPSMSPATVPVTINTPFADAQASARAPIDLSLDVSADEQSHVPAPVQAAPAVPASKNQDLRLDSLSPATVPSQTRILSKGGDAEDAPKEMDLSLDILEDVEPAPSVQTSAIPEADHSLEFDMSGLTLDVEQASASDSDPLETKLALAREFMGIGDNEGARIMAQEVAQDATGELKAQAEALLASLR